MYKHEDMVYGEYGKRQDEFGYLGPVSQREIIEHCHAIANLMNEAKDIVRDIERAEMIPVNTMATTVTRKLLAGEEITLADMPTPKMSRRDAIKILNRMGEEYGEDDIAEVMAGDAWYPTTTAEWAHYFDGAR